MNMDALSKAVREKVGSQDIADVAETIPICPFVLKAFVDGEVPSIANLTLICAWLGVSPAVYFAKTAPTTLAKGLERIAVMELDLAELRHSLIKANLEAQPEGGRVRQVLDIVVEMLYFQQWQREGIAKVKETLEGPEPEDYEAES